VSGWNAMAYDGKDTVLRVLRQEGTQFLDLVDSDEAWERPTGAGHWQVRDVVGHLVDTTEEYFRAFDAARSHGEFDPAYGLPGMAVRVDEEARAFRSEPRAALVERLRGDFDKMMGIFDALTEDDWSNLQVSATANNGAFGFITNAGNVKVRGVELESTMLPIDRLTLSLSGSFTKAVLQGNETAPPGIVITGAGVNGDYVPMSPQVTAQGSADYVIPVSDNLQILTHADASYMGTAWTQFARVNPYQHELPAYTLTGVRFGLENADNRWGVYLFVNNLLNVTGFIGKSGGASTGGVNDVQAVTVMPRTIGVSFRAKLH